MDDKEFQKIMKRYVLNIVIIFICVIVIILGGNNILPPFFQKIGVIVIVINCLSFTFFMKKYKNKK